MNPIVWAIPVFLATIAAEAWLMHRRGHAGYATADAITSLQLGTFHQLAGLFLNGVLWVGIYVAVYEGWRLASWPAASPWVWLAALLAYDFCAYWAHRLDHEVNVLWAAHVVHHSSEYFNLSTALRQSGTNAFLHWIFYLPLALAGVPPLVFFSVSLLHLLYQYWVHTELIGRLGWLDRILVTPSNHRVHHGQNDYCIDRNYGGLLIVWDRLFGTFAEERSDERVVYGVRKPLRSFDPLWGTVHQYVDLWRQMRARRGIGARLRLWFEPPGAAGSAPFEATAFQCFDPRTPAALSRYALLHYALSVPFVLHLLVAAPKLPLEAKLLYALGLVVTMVSLGGLLQGARGALRHEALRVLLLGVAFAASPNWFGQASPDALRGAMLLLGLLSALWLLQRQRVASAKISEQAL